MRVTLFLKVCAPLRNADRR